MKKYLGCAALLMLVLSSAELPAADKKKLSEEEKFQEEVKTAMAKVQDQASHVAVNGKFMLLSSDEIGDKAFPKIVGYVNQKGLVYPVMALDEKVLVMLNACNKKEVTLQGRFVEKGEQGKVLVTNLVLGAEASEPPPLRKRGRLY